MNYMVGLKNADNDLLDCICRNKEHIYEVYFSWGDFPNGRANQLQSSSYTPWELQDMQRQALRRLADEGIRLNLLFNANCYGAHSQSRAFFHKVGTTMVYVAQQYGLHSVTTTSPLVAKFVHQNFPGIEVRASVNMENCNFAIRIASHGVYKIRYLVCDSFKGGSCNMCLCGSAGYSKKSSAGIHIPMGCAKTGECRNKNNAVGAWNRFRKGVNFRGGIYNSKSVTEPLNG